VASGIGREEDIAATMGERARNAIQHASEVMGMTLDRTVASLAVVDNILAKLHDGLPGSFWRVLGVAPNNAELAMTCEMYGGYVGEIIRHEIGGAWVLPEGGPFAQAPSIAFGDELSSPVLKVYERITNPDATIPAYFEAMKERWSGENL
jgi:hypothetical protein